MRSRAFWLIGLAVLAATVGTLTFPWSHGQPTVPPRPLPPEILNPPAGPAENGNTDQLSSARPSSHASGVNRSA